MNVDQKTILVVEDERPLLEAIQAKLEKSNFAVVTARSVEQAMEYLVEINIDAIWLDHYLLGKEDGLDLVAKMKGSEGKWKAIPIFVVSNTATADKVQAYIQFGINKYYIKSEKRLDAIIEDVRAEIANNQKD